jgi:hypothetical protein
MRVAHALRDRTETRKMTLFDTARITATIEIMPGEASRFGPCEIDRGFAIRAIGILCAQSIPAIAAFTAVSVGAERIHRFGLAR